MGFFSYISCLMKLILKNLTYFLVASMMGLSTNVFSQTKEIDSLKSVVLKGNKDTNSVNALNDLANKFMRRGVFDTAMQYAQRANETALLLKFKNGLARSFI